MEWVQSLNKTLRYVEEHLTDENLTMEKIAQVSAYSNFYLQRLFYLMTGISLADYIRQRRLSAAGQELQTLGGKVIDVALKYGYETPESFQKAFRRFHGVTPSAAQKTHVQLRYLNPLQIQITLTGGTIMDYSLEEIGEMTVLGCVRPFHYDNGFAEIPKFWSEYYAKGMHKAVPGYLGVCFDQNGGPEFDYMIGYFCDPSTAVPEGYQKQTIAQHLWAKFRAVGALPDALQKVNRQIYTEWLPNNTDYDLAENMGIEMYTEGDMTSPDYVCELWIPVRRKE